MFYSSPLDKTQLKTQVHTQMKKSNNKSIGSIVGSKLAEISAVETRLNALRQEASNTLTSALRALPAEYGFSDSESFIKAVRNASKSAKSTRKASKTAKPRKARVSITPEIREKVVAELKAGAAPLAVANSNSLSLATVQNIKKAAGLVKARTASA